MASSTSSACFAILSLRYSDDIKGYHQMVLQANEDLCEDERIPDVRTLVVRNVPPYCNEASLNFVFERWGKIERVFIQKLPGPLKISISEYFEDVIKATGFKTAYVVFCESKSLDDILKSPSLPLISLNGSEHAVRVSMDKWVNEHTNLNFDKNALQSEIDKYMERYDTTLAKEREESRKSGPDEDGWIKVTKHNTKRVIPFKESYMLRQKQMAEKKTSKQQLVHFYKFQVKQSKLDRINELKEKFQQDKQRLAVMKATRKFRPFK